MKGTPYSIRNNEFDGDMAAWLRANAQDNDGELLRLKRNLRLARQEALTARQRQLLRMNFEQNKTVTEIGAGAGRQQVHGVPHAAARQTAALSMPALRAVVRA